MLIVLSYYCSDTIFIAQVLSFTIFLFKARKLPVWVRRDFRIKSYLFMAFDVLNEAFHASNKAFEA